MGNGTDKKLFFNIIEERRMINLKIHDLTKIKLIMYANKSKSIVEQKKKVILSWENEYNK